nr:hypothetical protein GCM10025699_61500 [Microbacterium flavescens]
MLLGQLRDRVDVAGVERGVLGDQLRLEQIARLVARVEDAGVEVRDAARRGALGAAVAGAVAALAVDDHRRRDDQPVDARSIHRGEHDGGAELVRRHVVGGVLEVDAEADLRRLMADGVDSDQRGVDDVGVAHVAVHEVDPLVEGGGAAVHVGAQRVEHPHAPPAPEGLLDDGRADEPGTTGDQQQAGEARRGPVGARVGHSAVRRAATGRASTAATASAGMSSRGS